MDVKTKIIQVLRLPIIIQEERPLREQAREFIGSGQARTTPLREFEERFGIEGTDNSSRRIHGYPKSAYYRQEDRKDIAKHRRIVDRFLSGERR